MVDGSECRIPDLGPCDVRWNMATLWEAIDAKPLDHGLFRPSHLTRRGV